jgi:hypothetical protein
MAVKKVIIRSCDRCGKEEELPADAVVQGNRVLIEVAYQGLNGRKTINDACEPCKKRIDELVTNLFLLGAKKEPGE